MFVRRQINKSGSISISVVDKSRGRYEVVKSFGAVKTAAEADLLENRAREFVREQTGEPETLFGGMDEAQLREYAASLDQGRIELAGPELIYGTLFDRLGLGEGHPELFRHMVLCRLFNPGSKLRTIGYLKRYLDKACEPEALYAQVDDLYLTDLRFSPTVPTSAQLLATPLSRTYLCLLSDADGSPVAARLLDRKGRAGARWDKSIQRLARKYGAVEPVEVLRNPDRSRTMAAVLRMSKKDMDFKPQLRRKKGRVEGHLCICLTAYAVQFGLERLLAATGITLPQVREAARTLFRLNYISPYTRRPKSVLVQMTPLQKQLFDLVH